MSNFTGIYRGIVHDLSDPAKRGRARLLVPAVHGNSVSGWATPVFGSSTTKVGDWAWVMFENGELNHPTWLAVNPGVTLSEVDDAYARLDGGEVVPIGAVLEYGGDTPPSDNYVMADGGLLVRADYPILFERYGTKYNIGGEPATHFRVQNRSGRAGVGRDAAQTEFDTLGETGGAKTHTLTPTEMPSHTHTQDSHNHTQNSHNHTQNSHNHTQDSHGHGSTGTVSADHNHSFGFTVSDTAFSWGTTFVGSGAGAGYILPGSTGTSGISTNHSHGTTPVTATNQATTATNQAVTATNQAVTATNQNTGGGAAHNNLQPFIVQNYIIRAR